MYQRSKTETRASCLGGEHLARARVIYGEGNTGIGKPAAGLRKRRGRYCVDAPTLCGLVVIDKTDDAHAAGLCQPRDASAETTAAIDRDLLRYHYSNLL
jgi:hypothetical protein